MKRGRFRSFVELRAEFPHADQVGKLTVFNIGRNKASYRSYTLQSAESLHSCGANARQYDKGKWKE